MSEFIGSELFFMWILFFDWFSLVGFEGKVDIGFFECEVEEGAL